MRDSGGNLKNLLRRIGAQLLRLVPGSAALGLKRDLRDAAWLSRADAVLVSYPKSGRTFVRVMLARLYQRRFGIDERKLLEFPILHKAPPDAPRLLFTHAGDTMRTPEEIAPDPKDYARTKLVLLARHPGDVAVSRFHHLKHRSRDKARRQLAEQPIEQFVWTPQGGIPSIVKFLNQFAAIPGVTILRYEDFVIEPEAALKRLADAIGLKTSQADIADAVKFGSFANLKQREREGYFQSDRMRPAKAGDERSTKVRTGGSGGYPAALGEAEADRIDAYLAEYLDPVFGYSRSAP